jgi:hypothetical protein
MSRNPRKRQAWREALLDELTDESEDERRDFTDPDRNLFESDHGSEMRDDGDDNPVYAGAKDKLHLGPLGKEGITKPEDIIYPVQVKPTDNLPGQMVEAGHGFIVNDPRSRPWKTARRTHCAHCGGPMPSPNVNEKKYRCEFQPDPIEGCQCSGCSLRGLVLDRHERNRGNPAKCCSKACTRLRDNERNAWKRAVISAEKRGEPTPPEPEDKGRKFLPSSGLRSSSEGTGRRYSAATGHRWNLPVA